MDIHDAPPPDRWRQIRELFDRVLDAPPEARETILDRECADDAELRSSVVGMLRADAASDDVPLIGALAPDLLMALDDTDAAERRRSLIGRRIGSWRLLRELGHGGMGAVYLAERDDGQYRQQAAVKLMQSGWTADGLLRRFRAERQILATLNHPNIARLIDGGIVDDDKPYLVLEYVEGAVIGDHCDRQRLAINERLALFLTICRAVAHAHRNLVVHCDLKPSNILVDADGVVKLLDFGIAKLLGPESDNAASTTRLFTPEYAAPEQIRGEPVTTSVDVYALGVLLFELLTGERPFAGSGAAASARERATLHTDPVRPSRIVQRASSRMDSVAIARRERPKSLEARLRGDVDAIVLKALRNDPAQRYASAEALAQDVERHLVRRPVHARQGDMRYRAKRFLQRHALAVGLATFAFAALLTGLAASLWQAGLVRQQRDIARSEADKAAAVADFMTDVFANANPIKTDGAVLTADDLLRQGVAEIEQRNELGATGHGALLLAMSRSYAGLGNGLLAESLAERAVAGLSSEASDRRSWIDARLTLATTLISNGKNKEALRELDAIRADGVAAGVDDPSIEARLDRSTGTALHNLDRNDEAWRHLQRVWRTMRGPEDALSDATIGLLPVSVAVLKRLSRFDEAVELTEPSYRASLATPDISFNDRMLINNARLLALQSAGRDAEAEVIARANIELAERIHGAEHPSTAVHYSVWAVTLRALERNSEAAAAMEKVLGMRRAQLAPDHLSLAEALVNAGGAHLAAAQLPVAIDRLSEALAIAETRGESDGRVAARSALFMAVALERSGRIDDALPFAERAVGHTRGPKPHFDGPAALGPRLTHARLLMRLRREHEACALLPDIATMVGGQPGARLEAAVLAAACQFDSGDIAAARASIASVSMDDPAFADVSDFARARLSAIIE